MIEWISILLTALYAMLFFYYWLGWNRTPHFKNADNANISFTVIIPARNEEKHISSLLEGLKKQSYPGPLYEVIVVDDHSDDNTAAIASSFDVQVIPAPDAVNSFKKRSIEAAIQIASGDYIVTTDADCVVTPTWLSTIAAFVTGKRSVFVAAPVELRGDNSLLHVFQELDFAMMQGITCASISQRLHAMSNGANLIYKKSAFHEVNGFAGIDHIASGDDMLLMEKMQRSFPNDIYYLKSDHAIVSTNPQDSWSGFIKQRVRWASKSAHYKDAFLTAILGFVYLYNLWFIVLIVLAGLGLIGWKFILIVLLAKILIELPLLLSTLFFFRKPMKAIAFPFLQPLHIIYIVIAGLFSLRRTYVWKGRRVR